MSEVAERARRRIMRKVESEGIQTVGLRGEEEEVWSGP